MTPEDELDQAQMLYLQLLIESGCKILFKTAYPQGGWARPKPYVMLKDRFGTHFIERIPEDQV